MLKNSFLNGLVDECQHMKTARFFCKLTSSQMCVNVIPNVLDNPLFLL